MTLNAFDNNLMKDIRKNAMPVITGKCTKFDGKIVKMCSRINVLKTTCSVYTNPQAKWRNGDCPMADEELRTNFTPAPIKKVRVGQQKQKRKNF